MEHRFYIKSKKERTRIQAAIALCSLIIILLTIFLSFKTGVYLIGILAFAIILSIIAPFFDVPALKKSGKLTYHSPLFITERPKDGVIKIHGGTLFDYLFTLDRQMNGNKRTNLIIQQYLQGLLNVMKKYGDGKNDNLKFRGTSYILNKRTAERIGFKMVKPDVLQKSVLIYNYFNILIANSIAKNRLSLPNLNGIRTFEADLNELLDRRDYIAKLNDRLKNNTADNI
ncbi:hypothetical protein MAR621_03003 [Maribacter dokdonensis]|uniref:hypothetical protein n=1 Tax=Maribacter dokdonensis TaxID=320912 RepID=UPI001B2694D2|nr:hypothetical protein [Maribacter dokdonensis]CAG2532809.1 hypothetical protein MAR621_03003 [Maribacter dokdonensis]